MFAQQRQFGNLWTTKSRRPVQRLRRDLKLAIHLISSDSTPLHTHINRCNRYRRQSRAALLFSCEAFDCRLFERFARDVLVERAAVEENSSNAKRFGKIQMIAMQPLS